MLELLKQYEARIKSNWTMIRIYLAQGDRQESLRSTILNSKACLIKVIEIKKEINNIRNEITKEIKLVA